MRFSRAHTPTVSVRDLPDRTAAGEAADREEAIPRNMEAILPSITVVAAVVGEAPYKLPLAQTG